MPKYLNRKSSWTQNNLDKFRIFIISEKEYLTEYFYDHLSNPLTIKRKKIGFFKKMNSFVGKSSQKCKSKFQKNEEQIYCEYLDLPREHFELFQYYKNRRINLKKNSIITRKTKTIKKYIKDEFFDDNEKRRKKILKTLLNNKNNKNNNLTLEDTISQVSLNSKSTDLNDELQISESIDDLFEKDNLLINFDGMDNTSFNFSLCETSFEDSKHFADCYDINFWKDYSLTTKLSSTLI